MPDGQAAYVMTPEQGRLLLIGYLTSAANALAQGGTADDYARQMVENARDSWAALGG